MVDHAPRYPSYDPEIERLEEKAASHSVAPYQARRPERSLPLFLSDRDGVPDPSEYLRPLLKGQGSYYASRILAGAAGGIAVALIAAVISSEPARDVIANAKASSVAALSVASVVMQPGQAPSKLPAAPELSQPPAAENQAPVLPVAAPAAASAGTTLVAAVTPTREDIKNADREPAQGSAPQAAAAPAAVAPVDVIHHLEPGEIATLLTRADALIGSGDLAAARLVLRRAAEAGDGRAAMMLGGTYDPTVLEKLGVRGVVPDMATARSWYEKAKRFGGADAKSPLDALARKQN